jgi:Amt family ammonium transporter
VTGLFYGGGLGQLIAEFIGSACITLATIAVTFALMYAVKATGTLRVSAEGEIQGLDLHEHDVIAYPEIVLKGNDGTPKSLHDLKGALGGVRVVPEMSGGSE